MFYPFYPIVFIGHLLIFILAGPGPMLAFFGIICMIALGILILGGKIK